MLRCCWLLPLALAAAQFTVSPSESSVPAPSPFVQLHAQTLTVKNARVRDLLRIAYQIRDYQIVGAPDWINTDRYDVTGTAGGEKSKIAPLMHELLSESFHLKIRRENRALPVYLMTLAPEGLRMHRSVAGRGANRETGPNVRLNHTLDAVGMDLPALAAFFTDQLNRIVIDRTGLQGRFDFHLEWHKAGASPSDDEMTNPSLATAAREQLGLELRSTEAPVEAIVVEHIEKPLAKTR